MKLILILAGTFGAQKTYNEEPTHPKRVTDLCGFGPEA